MPRKMYLLTALLFAGGALAQPEEVAANDRSGPVEVIDRNNSTSQYVVRWVKDEKAHFKRPDWSTATQEVWITGQLLVKDDQMDDVQLVIEVENGECYSARIRKNGRFDVLLTAGARARLTFQKPDHLAKEVLVDASDLNKNLIGRGEDRKVDFDVILVPEDQYPGLMHDGPVGSITFRRGTGAIMVHYHERLVAAEAICPRAR